VRGAARPATEPFEIEVGPETRVSALRLLPPQARALLVLAHGAGAGMRHPFLEDAARGLAVRGLGTLRFQFPYLEAGRRRPDAPAVATAAVRAAVARAAELARGLPRFAGGKSFGGRMTSTAEAAEPLGVAGLVFFGFPLHPPGRPATQRADHLDAVRVPMLFLQGTRDEFAQLELLQPVCEGLGARARLHLVEGADHSFRVPKRLGRSPAEVLDELLDAVEAFAVDVTGRRP
jgi:predicted alpha/beta-hydrolase family hydrolase